MWKTKRRRRGRVASMMAAAVALAAVMTASPAGAAPRAATAEAPTAGLNLMLNADPWKVVQTRRAPDGTWDAAREVPQFSSFYYWTTVIGSGQLRLFGLKPSGPLSMQFVQSTQQPDGSWSEPTPMKGLAELPVPNPPLQRGRAGAAVVNGQVQLAAIAPSGRLVHTVERPDGSWQPWGAISAPPGIGSDTFYSLATAEVNGELHIVATMRDNGSVLHTIRHANGTWDGWGNIMGVNGTPSPWGSPHDVVAAGVNGQLQVAVVNNSQIAVYHTIRTSGGNWSGWGPIGQPILVQPFYVCGADGANVNNELQLVFETCNERGTLFHTIRHANGSWDKAGNVQSAVDLSPWRPYSDGSAVGG
ncbi:hypothetical protein ACFRMQ_26680 [Kitasatospora sp. NPDC056783]|uniref:hypothetical protein n=1 Tax=Kitasatospora sp. NPDC056783 TaxID=3345943 RepID=UPI0036B0085D